MSKNIAKESKWIKEWEKQREAVEKQALLGEVFKQCLDDLSSGGRYYNPCWVSTSKGRVYSLYKKDFLEIKPKKAGKKNKNGEYTGTEYFYIGGKIAAHTLTANYFCDKEVVAVHGEENVEVHHQKTFDVEKGLVENNSAENLGYTAKPLHKIMSQIEDGRVPVGSPDKLAYWVSKIAEAKWVKTSEYIDENGNAMIKLTLRGGLELLK